MTTTKPCPDCTNGWIVQTGGEESVKVICPKCNYASLPETELLAHLAERFESLRKECQGRHNPNPGTLFSSGHFYCRCGNLLKDGLGYVYSRPENGLTQVVRDLGWWMFFDIRRPTDYVEIYHEIAQKHIFLAHVNQDEGLIGDHAMKVCILRAWEAFNLV